MKVNRILVAEGVGNVEIDLNNRLKSMGFDMVKLVSSPEDVKAYLKSNTVDLVLLDDFSDHTPNGIDVAKEIFEKYRIPTVLMITELRYKNDQAIPFPIIYKPAKDQELYHTLHREIVLQQNTIDNAPNTMMPESLFVRSDYRLIKIRLMDIYYVEANKDYVMIHTNDNVHKVHGTIKSLLEHLKLPQFIRIHRSYIVNRDKIASIKYPELVIEEKMKTLAIGGLYRKELFDQLNIL